MKKNYQKPTMNVVKIHSAIIICASPNNTVRDIDSDEIGYGGGSSTGGDGTGAHARHHSVWDDEEE